jgi:hypothetical protein
VVLGVQQDLEEILQHLVMHLPSRSGCRPRAYHRPPSRCARPTASSEKIDEHNGPTRPAVGRTEAEGAARVAVGASCVLVVVFFSRGRLVPVLDY